VLFKDIPGLEHIKSTLIRSVQTSHLAHALLFDGANGGGGLALALAFSTYINCENKSEEDACGVCASCAKMNKLIHPDFHSIFPIATSKKVCPSGVPFFWKRLTVSYRNGWIILMLKTSRGIFP
jgi:DNA polymerase-3 subunit delta'